MLDANPGGGQVLRLALRRVRPVELTHPELLDMLSSAERLLDVTGNAVTLCPTYGDACTGQTAGTRRA